VVLDDFSNVSKALRRVPSWRRRRRHRLEVIEGDIRDPQPGAGFGGNVPIDAVISFRRLRPLAESVADPLRLLGCQCLRTQRLLMAMAKAGCRTIVFSTAPPSTPAGKRCQSRKRPPLRPVNP